jgi:parallel beta-helix repeat protein
MRGRTFLRIATGVLLFFLSPGLTAAVTWYVDGGVSESGDGKSWETAFEKIEEGVDTATDGDTVIVAGGTYFETIRFDGKSVHLVSRDGPVRTVIDASGSGTVVTFDFREGSGAIFEGFSVTGGGGSNSGSGIYCEGSSPTIFNCRIYRNISTYPNAGGGICCCDANPTISHCVIYSNWSHEWGGGIWCYKSSPRVEGCAIVQNSAFYGGGGIACDNECFPVIVNCTIFGNLSPWRGGGIDSGWKSSTLVINTVVWGNQQGDIEVSSGSVELRSCVYDGSVWSLGGEFIDGGGNISADPMFAKPLMPIPHLSAASPCIDAGLEQDLQPTDIDGEPRVTGSRVDIGADEFSDSDADGLPDWWEVWLFSDCASASAEDDPDHDGVPNLNEYFRGTDPAAPSPTRFYVDAERGNDGWNGKTWNYAGGSDGPKATIQGAVEAAFEGDEIIVVPGTYEENITFAGKNLHVSSASGRDATVVKSAGLGAVVTFGMGEGRGAILESFGVTEGHAYSGGGFDCFRSSPTIRDCAVYENWGATEGGRFYCLESSPLIERCAIYNNGTEERGAAIHCDKCNPTILSCNIFGNEIGCCGPAGIYLRESGGLVADCKLYSNTSPGVGAIRCDDSWTTFTRCAVFDNSSNGCSGFLLASSPVSITNCIVSNNISRYDGAVRCEGSSPTIINCTIHGNICQGSGGVVVSQSCAALLVNTIVWDNKSYDIVCGDSETDWTTAAVLLHCDVGEARGSYLDGGGNIAADPLITKDFLPVPHLLPGSPCIDAGTWMSAPSSDMEGDPRPSGLAPDIGADEVLDSDFDRLPDSWEIRHFGDISAEPEADDDGDGLSNLEECARDYPPLHPTPTTTYVNAYSGNDAWDGTSRIHLEGTVGPKATIQAGIESALDGDIVTVLPGTYIENINFKGKRIRLVALSGPEKTVIDAGGAGRGVTFESKETTESVLEGFGITGGNAEKGGGILCEKASPTIIGCHVYGNKTTGWASYHGAGIYCYAGSPTISDCRIYNNVTAYDWGAYGGGIYVDSPSLRLTRCLVENNFATESGGGISLTGSNITLTDCTIRNNVASKGWGGGVNCMNTDSVTISNCTIRGNRAAFGGGIYLYYCRATSLSDSIIAHNSSTESGGGIGGGDDSLISGCLIFRNTAATEGGAAAYSEYSRPRMVNCTVVGNTAQGGCGGIFYSSNSVIYNCIVWDNGDDLSGCAAKYSCIEDTGDENEGEGVIHDDPLFVCPEKEDFHLRPDSPCVNAGTTEIYYGGLPALDIDGEHRPFGTALDIGADEYIDQDSDELPDYWEIRWFGDLWMSKEDDPDDDGLPNTKEFVRLCDPTSADTDADGQGDGAEASAGTDPLDAASRFEIVSVRVADTRLEIECSTVVQREYRLLVSKDLIEWIPFAGPFTAVGDTLRFADTTSLTSLRFYRVEVLP